jgi:hypothetical protein
MPIMRVCGAAPDARRLHQGSRQAIGRVKALHLASGEDDGDSGSRAGSCVRRMSLTFSRLGRRHHVLRLPSKSVLQSTAVCIKHHDAKMFVVAKRFRQTFHGGPVDRIESGEKSARTRGLHGTTEGKAGKCKVIMQAGEVLMPAKFALICATQSTAESHVTAARPYRAGVPVKPNPRSARETWTPGSGELVTKEPLPQQ